MAWRLTKVHARKANSLVDFHTGVYLTLDATGLLDDIPPALDLFGTKEVEREWVSLQDLKVDSTDDPKPTFISGFIVRQLVAESVIDVRR